MISRTIGAASRIRPSRSRTPSSRQTYGGGGENSGGNPDRLLPDLRSRPRRTAADPNGNSLHSNPADRANHGRRSPRVGAASRPAEGPRERQYDGEIRRGGSRTPAVADARLAADQTSGQGALAVTGGRKTRTARQAGQTPDATGLSVVAGNTQPTARSFAHSESDRLGPPA